MNLLKKQIQRPRRADGRFVTVALLAGYFGLLGAGALAGSQRPWAYLGVPQMSPPFADLYNVTSALDCVRRGFDPLRQNPCDVASRPMNYPRLWLAAGAFGVTARWTTSLGVALGICFFAASICWVGRLRRAEGVMVAILLCSPSVMLLVERGNVDAVVFVMCVGGILLLARDGGAMVLGESVVLVAAALKLFPAFALPVIAAKKGKRAGRLGLAATACVAFLCYLWIDRDDLLQIAKVAPRWFSWSYGAPALPMRFFGDRPLVWETTYLVLGLIALSAGWRFGDRWSIPRVSPATHRGLGFLAGVLVYSGTFALGTNWAYRLAFVLLLVPQLLSWIRRGGSSRIWGLALYWLIAAIMYNMASDRSARVIPIPNVVAAALWAVAQVATWGVALAFWASAPAWMGCAYVENRPARP